MNGTPPADEGTGHAGHSHEPQSSRAPPPVGAGETPTAAQVARLQRLILDVIVMAFGPPASGWPRRAVEWLFRIPAGRFAEVGADFDLHLARGGFAEAARQVLRRFVRGWRAYGSEHVPPQGPLLVLSNHPGAYDVLVVGAALCRDDLKVLAGGVAFLRSFSAAGRGLIFSDEDLHSRATALRAAVRHLRTGGALLTFPGGTIDADLAITPGGYDELERWSPSIDLMLRHVPDCAVLVAIVSGVVVPACYHNPVTRLRKSAVDRRRLAEVIQVAGQMLRGRPVSLVPVVSFAEPVTVSGLAMGDDAGGATGAIIARAHRAMDHHLSIVDHLAQ